MTNETQIRNSIQNSANAIYTCDESGFVKFYNSAAVKLWGREPVAGKDLWCGSLKMFGKDGSYLAPDKRPMAIAIKERRPVYDEEIIIQRPDGSMRNINPFPYPLFDKAGKLTGGVNMLIDVTELVKAGTKMSEAIERYDMLAKATSDTIWDWDIVNDKMLYNEGITKTFGYESSEIKDVNDWWKKNIHPDDRLLVSRALDRVFVKKRQNFQLTYRFRCADGTFKYIYDRAFIIFNKQGKATRMIGAMQDVTYQMEEEIRITKATNDAQESERHQIGLELHDNVNQLLTACLLNLAMMKKVAPGKNIELAAASQGYLNTAIAELRKISHRLAPVSLNKVSIKESFDRLITCMNVNNQFSITTHFDDFWETGISNEIQLNLYRILQEQLTNTVKYSGATTIDISVTKRKNYISMKVADNGKGFDPTRIHKGIGLTNMEKRAQLLSGLFTLNTSEGNGCEIIVAIPLDNNINMI